MSTERRMVSLICGSAETSVNLHGATIVSWKVNGQEQLFTSSQAVYDNKKAIRGGIPVVFPNFGPWECGPQHGFARTAAWSCSTQPHQRDGGVCAVFTLQDSPETRAMWNYGFRVDYTVTVTDSSLEGRLVINNTGGDEFDFTCLLHTYFRVADISKTKVQGLRGLTYIDKVLGSSNLKEVRECVTIEQNEDRVYMNAPNELQLLQSDKPTMTIHKDGFPDAVLWNPWREKAAAMSDFGNEEYTQMLCVEPGAVGSRIKLAPGASYQATQKLIAKL